MFFYNLNCVGICDVDVKGQILPDFEQIIKQIQTVLQLVFGKNVPLWISPLVGWAMLFALVLCALWGTLFLLSKIQELWVQNFWPLFFNREQKQRSLHRRYFAEHVENEIIRLGRQEEWKDYRFTELEAEVEAEGRRRVFSFFPFFSRTSSGLRRENSLSHALTSSQERLILLEGEPGSGKSIALRHVAQMMAKRAKSVKGTKSIIPIYVNLKELERCEGEAIDRNLIETFVLVSLKRIKDRDVDKFLDEEFDPRIRNGTWFFLFDSFDEIPEVLSSVEVDDVIKNYGNAIEDFLGGMNRCRGIVASRLFRGPKYLRWPRFTVLSLSESRQLQFIRKANLKRVIEDELIGRLVIASSEIQVLASNPLFLGLLCDQMREGHPFPSNTHVVFENYINGRFTRDKLRLQTRFKLDPHLLRTYAEMIAFYMVADPNLGLSPTRQCLKLAIGRFEVIRAADIDTVLDALEFMKLARSEEGIEGAQSNRFTFAHRRFQEYFATCVVLKEPSLVPPELLLFNARWRETAVVMCQTQPLHVLAPIIEQVDTVVVDVCDKVVALVNEIISLECSEKYIPDDKQREVIFGGFPWPHGLLSLLKLLQEGFAGRMTALPQDLRVSIGHLVQMATEVGQLSDKRWALEVASIVPDRVLTSLLTNAFLSSSNWLKEIAYQQTAQLNSITPVIAQGIRNTIVELAGTHQLQRQRHVTKAHLMRLYCPEDYLVIMRLLLVALIVDRCTHIVFSLIFIVSLLNCNNPSMKSISIIFPLFLPILLSFLVSYQFDKNTNVSEKGIIIFLARIPVVFFTAVSMSVLFNEIFSISSIDRIFLFSCCYFAFFLPSSYLASKSGNFTKVYWWPLMPIWPLLNLFHKPMPILLFMPRLTWFFKHIYIIVLVVVTLIGIGLEVYLLQSHPFWGGLVILLFSGIAMIILIRGISVRCYSAYQDKLRWRKWFKNHNGIMTCEEFCEAVSFHSKEKILLALRIIRNQSRININVEAEEFLNKLAFEIELRQRYEKCKRKDKNGKLTKEILPVCVPGKTATKEIRDCARLLWVVGPELLDEISLLLQDVRRARQTLSDS